MERHECTSSTDAVIESPRASTRQGRAFGAAAAVVVAAAEQPSEAVSSAMAVAMRATRVGSAVTGRLLSSPAGCLIGAVGRDMILEADGLAALSVGAVGDCRPSFPRLVAVPSFPHDEAVIRAALFDFGGVILSSPFEAFAAYEREAGLPVDFIRGLNATNPDTNAWSKLERSEVGLAEFCTLFEAEAHAQGHTLDGAEVLSRLHGEIRPEMVEAVRRCGERLATALLTNNFVAPEEAASDPTGREGEIAAIVDLFDVVIESSVVGVRKPDPAFYDLACRRLDIEPGEAVFLDDLGINLKPARAMGMTTIKVIDPHVALAELETLLGLNLGDIH